MRQFAIRVAAATGATALTLSLVASPTPAHDKDNVRVPTLTGFASLPAQTYVPASDPSGSALGTAPINGVVPPFADQPIQGFSGIVRGGGGAYEVLSDNGFGNKANSADYALRVQRLAPVFQTGAIDVLGGFHFTDPNGKVPFPLTRPDRVLTGSDFDVESITRAIDGTYWVGDEFGPFLLHFDRTGRLLSAPVSLPGVFAPENPFLAGGTPNLAGSKGFEGMAISPDGRYLYPLLEGPVAGDPTDSLRMSEFDTRTGAYTGKKWIYQLDSPAHAIGDAISVDANRFLVIERDGGQGDAALVKKIYMADKRDKNRDGKLDKTLVVDLLNIANPKGLGGFGPVFRFPFTTIEDVLIVDEKTIAVLNDNNYPSSSGRTPGLPDNNEFITIRLPKSLNPDGRVLR
ncbi:esterase-like activity of phytase family protein [Phytohabitans flavus]|uniref:Glycerophosphoryl diester phosphodiesterase n=1 Tax=Phytohabitans flavus TaxID=1076124 RepID=A0A6F8XKE9_9ACTN|nr:esterase-like activity of phytase family protein [Phytohabitans flavus]BCB74290.1 glycerophosphoryl diester phosphodiesterase [Phytohabitans flavus]